MNVKININSAAVKARMTEKTHDAMKLLMSNFLKDCNDYAPQDQSVLINSQYNPYRNLCRLGTTARKKSDFRTVTSTCPC